MFVDAVLVGWGSRGRGGCGLTGKAEGGGSRGAVFTRSGIVLSHAGVEVAVACYFRDSFSEAVVVGLPARFVCVDIGCFGL